MVQRTSRCCVRLRWLKKILITDAKVLYQRNGRGMCSFEIICLTYIGDELSEHIALKDAI